MAMNRLRPADLRAAIESDGLSLHYQIQVHVPDGRLAGVEGFVRWPHPAQGLLGPGEVIPLVEDGLLYVLFDRWVIRELCRQVVAWRKQNVLVPLVAANVWPQTLRHPTFADMVSEAITLAGADPTMLEIQLPRGALADPADAPAIEGLHRLGARVASDDPARGVPVHLRADTIVIPRGADAETIGRAVEAARASVARLVAEGVETEHERDVLVAAGCEIVQGFVFGPEISASDVQSLVVS